MWFNSMQREEPYLPLTLTRNLVQRYGIGAFGNLEIQVLHGCRQLVS